MMHDDPKQIFRLFVKFIPEEYVDLLVEEGLLYMNNVEYFRRIQKENTARGDKYEGCAASYDSSKVRVIVAGKELKDIIRVEVSYDHELETNLYCLTAINDYDLLTAGCKLKLSDDLKKIGGKAVVILGAEIGEFLCRVKATAESDENIEHIGCRPVEYVRKDEHSGEMGIFRKFQEYSWQYEWRIALKQKLQKGAYDKFRIGSIKDICKVFDTEKFIKDPIIMRQE